LAITKQQWRGGEAQQVSQAFSTNAAFLEFSSCIYSCYDRWILRNFTRDAQAGANASDGQRHENHGAEYAVLSRDDEIDDEPGSDAEYAGLVEEIEGYVLAGHPYYHGNVDGRHDAPCFPSNAWSCIRYVLLRLRNYNCNALLAFERRSGYQMYQQGTAIGSTWG